ncbi:MAG: RsmE family RNA methyltransferase [Pirellula sp.]|jgi:16S rRNA (uracil1498-N3)-methyltransferase
MRAPRFLVPDVPDFGLVALPETESHHATKVLRLKVGESIELFDGVGYVGTGVIVELGRRDVTVQVSQKRFAPYDHFGRLTLAVALPKGDRQRGTIEKLTELGADRLVPLETNFSVAEVNDRNANRLDRYAIEACKQSRRNRLVQIDPSMNTTNFCREIRTVLQAGIRTWVLHPPDTQCRFDSVPVLSTQFLTKPLAGVIFAIGPEGGFSDSEIASMMEAGAGLLSLGDRILRVETAVAVACTLGSLWVGQSRASQSSEGPLIGS